MWVARYSACCNMIEWVPGIRGSNTRPICVLFWVAIWKGEFTWNGSKLNDPTRWNEVSELYTLNGEVPLMIICLRMVSWVDATCYSAYMDSVYSPWGMLVRLHVTVLSVTIAGRLVWILVLITQLCRTCFNLTCRVTDCWSVLTDYYNTGLGVVITRPRNWLSAVT
jgi:hypothetical protein